MERIRNISPERGNDYDVYEMCLYKSTPNILTNKSKSYIIQIEKGKTFNGYAKCML